MEHFPFIAIELVMVLGGALAFSWWQFRDLDREKAKRAKREAAEKAAAQAEDQPPK